jgi:hypothetical protein
LIAIETLIDFIAAGVAAPVGAEVTTALENIGSEAGTSVSGKEKMRKRNA